MKRESEKSDESRTSKRFRRHRFSSKRPDDAYEHSTGETSKPFDGLLVRRNATEVYRHVGGDVPEGYLEFTVFMKWNLPKDKFRIHGESKENGNLVRFDLWFKGPCYDHFVAMGLTFDIGDHICISLKGASLQELKATSPKTLPNCLLYSEGVTLQFVSKKTPLSTGMLIDTWTGNIRGTLYKVILNALIIAQVEHSGIATPAVPEKTYSADDWFSTPPMRPMDSVADDLMKVDSSTTQQTTKSVVQLPINGTDQKVTPRSVPSEGKEHGLSTTSVAAGHCEIVAAERVMVIDALAAQSTAERPVESKMGNESSDDAGQDRGTSPLTPQDTVRPLTAPAQQQAKRLYRDFGGGRGQPPPAKTAPSGNNDKQDAPSDIIGERASNLGKKKAEKKAKRAAKRAAIEAQKGPAESGSVPEKPLVNVSLPTIQESILQELAEKLVDPEATGTAGPSGETGSGTSSLLVESDVGPARHSMLPISSPPPPLLAAPQSQPALPLEVFPTSVQESSKPAEDGEPFSDLRAGCHPSDVCIPTFSCHIYRLGSHVKPFLVTFSVSSAHGPATDKRQKEPHWYRYVREPRQNQHRP